MCLKQKRDNLVFLVCTYFRMQTDNIFQHTERAREMKTASERHTITI